MTHATAIAAVDFAGVEVAIPDSMSADGIVPGLTAGFEETGMDLVEVYVDVPRDDRRTAVLDALADSDFDARFHVGGTGERPLEDAELADLVLGAVSRHLPFKAAGDLRHAVRTTDPTTGDDEHGFLNLFLAVDAARQGVDTDGDGLRDQILATIADRDRASVASRVHALSPERALAVRSSFTSLDAASFVQPLSELRRLGLISADGT